MQTKYKHLFSYLTLNRKEKYISQNVKVCFSLFSTTACLLCSRIIDHEVIFKSLPRRGRPNQNVPDLIFKTFVYIFIEFLDLCMSRSLQYQGFLCVCAMTQIQANFKKS